MNVSIKTKVLIKFGASMMCVELRAKKLSNVHVQFAEHVKSSYTHIHNTSHVCTRCLDMIQASNAMRTLVPQTKTENKRSIWNH